MEQLEIYIEKLLIEHDCVIVPGLGGFVVQHESAKLLDGSLIPPRATIGFNRKLAHTDGLLASELARARNIPYRQAAACVQQAVDRLHTALREQGTVRIGRLGRLTADAAGVLDFRPDNADFLPDNFGLAPLYVAPLSARQRRITLSVSLHPAWYKYAAACVLAALLCVSPKMHETATVDYASLNPINWATVLAEKEQAAQAECLAAFNDSIKNAECTETQQVLENERHKFHIIVATLDQTAADKYCQTLADTDFPCAHVFPFKNGLYYVATQSFKSKKEALAAMQQLRKTNPKHSKAWVLCQ